MATQRATRLGSRGGSLDMCSARSLMKSDCVHGHCSLGSKKRSMKLPGMLHCLQSGTFAPYEGLVKRKRHTIMLFRTPQSSLWFFQTLSSPWPLPVNLIAHDNQSPPKPSYTFSPQQLNLAGPSSILQKHDRRMTRVRGVLRELKPKSDHMGSSDLHSIPYPWFPYERAEARPELSPKRYLSVCRSPVEHRALSHWCHGPFPDVSNWFY